MLCKAAEASRKTFPLVGLPSPDLNTADFEFLYCDVFSKMYGFPLRILQ